LWRTLSDPAVTVPRMGQDRGAIQSEPDVAAIAIMTTELVFSRAGDDNETDLDAAMKSIVDLLFDGMTPREAP
jgi:hypothetical protein